MTSTTALDRNKMSYQLINFNISTNLKDSLDEIIKSKRISRTAIINQLLEAYCRAELHYSLVSKHQTGSNSKQDDDDREMPLTPLMTSYDRFDGGWSL